MLWPAVSGGFRRAKWSPKEGSDSTSYSSQSEVRSCGTAEVDSHGNLAISRGEGCMLLSCEPRWINVKTHKGIERAGSKNTSGAKDPMNVDAEEVGLAVAGGIEAAAE